MRPPGGPGLPPPPPALRERASSGHASGPASPNSPQRTPKSPRAGAPLALAATAAALPAPPPPVRVDVAFPEGGRAVGVGLTNLGNSCFLNAVLQALAHTPPLSNALLARRGDCCGSEACAHCLLTAQVAASLAPGAASPSAPRALFRALPSLARTLTCGRQEDAHEFLRALLDAADRGRRAGLVGAGRPPPPTWATEVEAAFRGTLRSRVTCGRCGAASDTLDPFLDLALDPGPGDIAACLRAWAAPETLAGGDAYACGRCGPVPAAAKALAVSSPPAALVLTLKRFKGLYGKDARHVALGETLTLPPAVLASADGPPPTYSLDAVVVHSGSSAASGHYYAFVRGRGGRWWRADDSWVSPVDAGTVLSSCAYMLFYVHDGGKAAAAGKEAAAAAAAVKATASPAAAPARERTPPPLPVSPADALQPPPPLRSLWRPMNRPPSLAAQVAATPLPERAAPRAPPPPAPRSLTKRQIGGFRSRGLAMVAAASGTVVSSPGSGERRPAPDGGAGALAGSVEKRLRHE